MAMVKKRVNALKKLLKKLTRKPKKKITHSKKPQKRTKSTQYHEKNTIFKESKTDVKPLDAIEPTDADIKAANFVAHAPESHDPTSLYLHELGFKPLLTAKDELRVARAVMKGDAKARTKMIESNLRLVVKIARHYCHRG